MNTLAVEVEPLAIDVIFTADHLHVVLADGREIFVPLVWFPRLYHATPEQRAQWRSIGGGMGLHWEDLDEDIAIETLLRTR